MTFKKIAIVVAFLCCKNMNAQNLIPNYKVVSQFAADMVYDSINSKKIILSIPSADVFKGNSIGFFDADSAKLQENYFIGSDPGCISLTANGKFLYTALNGSASVKKFDLINKVTIQTIAMPVRYSQQLFPSTISCVPDNDSTIAIALKDNYRNAKGINIYRNGIKLKDSISEYPSRVNVAHFYNSSILYGYDNQSSGFSFYTMVVDSNGVKFANALETVFSGFNIDFTIHGNTAVSDNGKSIDVSVSPPHPLGTFQMSQNINSGYQQKVAYDPYQKLWCFASRSISYDTLYIQRFHESNFLLKDIIRIPNIRSDVSKMICWGDSTKLAISTLQGQFIIVNGLKKNTSIIDLSSKSNELLIYPNPTSDESFIDYHKKVDITIFNTLGEIVLQESKTNKINIGTLPKAVYTIYISDDEKNLISVNKLIKK